MLESRETGWEDMVPEDRLWTSETDQCTYLMEMVAVTISRNKTVLPGGSATSGYGSFVPFQSGIKEKKTPRRITHHSRSIHRIVIVTYASTFSRVVSRTNWILGNFGMLVKA